ncbi:3-deoxy-D-manno-octulosonic acid transferase [Candidatus Pelagibacter sp.]|nr:3-deoxy-D-manno-octulosonic acid transferase [Candidatus Pelagibacter sp.]
MYFVYRVFTNLIILISPIIILFRLIKKKEELLSVSEKFCIYSKKNNLKSIWFHAASVGELMSILPIIDKLERNKKIKQVLVTTTTVSSAKIFQKKKFKKTHHKYYPLDTNFLTNKFIRVWKPQIAIFVDSEIWPNMIENLYFKKIPIVLLNARITRKSFNRWNLVRNFAETIFSKISLALPSNLETKMFLQKLGVKKIKIAGNLKYYGKNKINFKGKINLNKKFNNFKVWCAASTHNSEEIFISKLHKDLKKNEKKLLTIIIPRHINRSKNIINNLKNDNLNVITYSSGKKLKKDTDIYLVDTYGEASRFYSLSNVTFMGGSMIKHGGQNPLEPARLGNYIISGPNIENFKEIYKFLEKNRMSIRTSNTTKIKKIISMRLNKKLSNKNKKKIFRIGDKILNKNFSYISEYF